MNDSSIFFTMRPAYPWSIEPIGLPALAIVAGLLVAFTIWTYSGHPNATRRRIFIVLCLRMLALLVALITALRPSVGVQENPKNPSVLIFGLDFSESMTVKDEVNGQARIDAVRKILEKCQPILDELAAEQNVTTVMYKFSTPDFSEAMSRYSPGDPADGKRSDYGTYLNRTFERWLGERFIRGHLIVGDGADNGEAFSPISEAKRWGGRGVPITTFTVGQEGSNQDAHDIVAASVEAEPSPAPIKTDVTVVGTVHAYGFIGTRVTVRVTMEGPQMPRTMLVTQDVVLEKERDNKVRITIKAPPTKGEYKLRFQVGQDKDGEIVPLRGEINAENNQSETYLTVTKDGVRLLIIDRLRPEETRIRDVLRSEKRFDVNQVIRQTDGQITAAAEELLDLDSQAYDVIIIGDITPAQLTFRRGDKTLAMLDKIRDRVMKNGMGVMFLGGEQSFRGMPADLLPVSVPEDPRAAIVENVNKETQLPNSRYQTIPTEEGLSSMMRLAKDEKDSIALWAEVNTSQSPHSRLTGYNKMFVRSGARVLAWASQEKAVITAGTRFPDKGADPLLVSWQIGDGDRGRVLAFGAFDSYLWEKLGQPKTKQGSEIHSRFWKQCVLWLAHQEDEEGQAYIRPAHRQLKVGGEQTLRLGVKLPSGQDDPNAEMTVKIVPLPDGKIEPDQADIDKAKQETVVRDDKGAKVLFRPRTKGEYFAVLTSPKKDAAGKPMVDAEGKPVLLRATAKFIAVPDISDEMLKVSADHENMIRISSAAGGKALRLEDLPSFLKELKEQKDTGPKPRPKYYPDWRRNHSQGFLTLWLVVFVLLLGAEWGLRRLWGMV
jgi:uncharacterized membrane protein